MMTIAIATSGLLYRRAKKARAVSTNGFAFDVLIFVVPRVPTGKRSGQSVYSRFNIAPSVIKAAPVANSRDDTPNNDRNNLTHGVRNGAEVNNTAVANRDNSGNQEARPRGVFHARR